MKPHMNHIVKMLARKQIAEEAKNVKTSYRRYWDGVERARKLGFKDAEIIQELETEAERIRKDAREGDAIFQDGVHNSKVSCLTSITMIISEIRGEN